MNMNKTNYPPIIINERYQLFPVVELFNQKWFLLRFYLKNIINKKQAYTNSFNIFSSDFSKISEENTQLEINYLIDIEKRDVDILCKYFEALERVQ